MATTKRKGLFLGQDACHGKETPEEAHDCLEVLSAEWRGVRDAHPERCVIPTPLLY